MPETSKLLRAVLGSLPTPLVLSRLDDGLVLFANERAARAFGIPLAKLVGSTTPDVYVNVQDRRRIVEIIRRDGRLLEHEVLLRGGNGGEFWALASSEPLTYEGQPALCTTFQDITARKVLDTTLRHAREFAEDVLATVREPVVALDRDLRVVTVNRAFSLAFGPSAEAAAGTPVRELFEGARIAPDLEPVLARVWTHGGAVTDLEVVIESAQLGSRTMQLNARKLYRPGNNTDSILVSLQDVTAQRRERDELVAAAASAQHVAEQQTAYRAETERRLMSFLRNMPGIAYRCRDDASWTMEFLSEGCLALTGYAPSELVGNNKLSYAELLADEDRDRVRQAVDAAVAKRAPFQMEYRIRTKQGDTKWVWEQGVAIFDEFDPHRVVALEGIIHDITARRLAEQEREEMEVQMRAAQRMEAVGRLAGGVAHDFNNLLTVIQSYASFLKEQFRSGDPAREDVEVILQTSESAARLTNQLLAFSRRQVQELVVVNLNDVVQGIDKMLGRLLGEDVAVVTSLAHDLGNVRVDMTQMEQVIVNLAVNARDAMPDGGRLTIETANARLEDPYGIAKKVAVPPGDYVMLAVSDTGTGMDRDTQSRLFEPFFTTKAKGKGTGLGLSTVFGIVKQSGGYIWVYSEPGRGSTFKIYLPQTREEESASVRWAASTDARGSETILLVEDEELVRKAAARILRRHGYRVIEAAHGGEAIVLCEQAPSRIHLLITDVVMPHVNGKEVATRALTLQPEIRVLYMSGYTDNAVVHHGVLDEGVAFLQKPFTEEGLVRKVRDTLDRT